MLYEKLGLLYRLLESWTRLRPSPMVCTTLDRVPGGNNENTDTAWNHQPNAVLATTNDHEKATSMGLEGCAS